MAPTDHPCRSKNATPSVVAKVKGAALSKLGICRIILRTIARARRFAKGSLNSASGRTDSTARSAAIQWAVSDTFEINGSGVRGNMQLSQRTLKIGTAVAGCSARMRARRRGDAR